MTENKSSKDELLLIDKADDLHIAPFREDGKTYGNVMMPVMDGFELCQKITKG